MAAQVALRRQQAQEELDASSFMDNGGYMPPLAKLQKISSDGEVNDDQQLLKLSIASLIKKEENSDGNKELENEGKNNTEIGFLVF